MICLLIAERDSNFDGLTLLWYIGSVVFSVDFHPGLYQGSIFYLLTFPDLSEIVHYLTVLNDEILQKMVNRNLWLYESYFLTFLISLHALLRDSSYCLVW